MSDIDAAETAAPAAREPAPPPQKRSVAQLALDHATEDCTAFANLARRLETVRVAFEGKGPEPHAQATGQLDPRPTSHLEGLSYIHGCNLLVIRQMDLVIGRFEDILDCRVEPGH